MLREADGRHLLFAILRRAPHSDFIVSDTGRRRRRTDDENVRIVEESHRHGMTIADVPRRHEISRYSP